MKKIFLVSFLIVFLPSFAKNKITINYKSPSISTDKDYVGFDDRILAHDGHHFTSHLCYWLEKDSVHVKYYIDCDKCNSATKIKYGDYPYARGKKMTYHITTVMNAPYTCKHISYSCKAYLISIDPEVNGKNLKKSKAKVRIKIDPYYDYDIHDPMR